MPAILVPATAVVLTSVTAAIVALLALSAFPRRGCQNPVSAASGPTPKDQAVFLFDRTEMIDATAPARNLLESVPALGSEWDRLASFLAAEFASFAEHFAAHASFKLIEMRGCKDENLLLRVEQLGRLTRLTLIDLSDEGQGYWVDGLSLIAQEKELSTLRETLAAAPLLIWRVDDKGTVTWANDAYVEHAADLQSDESEVLTWPLPGLFPDIPRSPRPDDRRRVKMAQSGSGGARWYEWHMSPCADGTLFFAFPADAIVKAEMSLREFIQTLTKTFAQLPIGLAIFDRNRQLAMFNPALVDLTALDIAFLSARPTLFDFLDRLREGRMIPEPKNYRSWRDQVAAVERAAASGSFEETWSLATGQTYKVTGQPHPNGALAFQIENISAETTLTRQYRAEIELGQEILDAFEEAVAVFSSAGELVASNTAYGSLWGLEPKSTLGVVGILDASRHWQTRSRPTLLWGEVREFVASIDERAEWGADVDLLDGRRLACRFVPLSDGRTLAGFLPGPAPDNESPIADRHTDREERADA